MSNADTKYSARFSLPELIERGRAETLTCPVYVRGELAIPESGTVTIMNGNGTEVVANAAVTVANGVASYSLSASALNNEAYSDGWLVKWTLVMPDGLTYTFQNEAALVRTNLHPVVSDHDLFQRESSLAPNSDDRFTSDTDYQIYLNEAWIEINQRLISRGKRPYLILSPYSLRMPHLYLTLAIIYENKSLGSASEKAMLYRQLFEESFKTIAFNYDENNDGMPESTKTGAKSGVIWTIGAYGRRSRWRFR